MAYGVKYRCEFKDRLGNTIQADIKQDGFSGSITYVKGSSNPLSVDWPGDRENIFNPIRGAQATLSMMAETDGQFNEFFEANNKEYQLEIYDGRVSRIAFKGWLMLSDYYESMNAAPYEVSVSAYDLGYLQELNWDKSRVADDSVMDVIVHILGQTGLELSIVDEVNIYEDSISSGTTDSMLTQINIHQAVFMDDSWESITYYEALKRILLPFNAFIVQDFQYFRICRIPDMPYSHRYRVFDESGVYQANTTTDRTVLLSSFDELHRTGVMMTCPNYKELKMRQIPGLRNLVNNGLVGDVDADPYDYWQYAGGAQSPLSYSDRTYNGSTTYSNVAVLELDHNSSVVGRTYIDHIIEYDITTGMALDVSYFWESFGADTGNPVIQLKAESGGTDYYMSMETGLWRSDTTESALINEGETTSLTPQPGNGGYYIPSITNGKLTIRIFEANYTGTGKTFINLSVNLYAISVIPSVTRNFDYKLYDLEINSNNIDNSPEIEFFLGDTIDIDNPKAFDCLLGSLTIASDGSATDSWTPLNDGGRTDTLLNLARECYQAQFENPARRIQATLLGNISYMTILKDSSDRCYLPATLTREFGDNRFTGEWIEIKQGLGDELVTAWTNISFNTILDNGDTTFTGSATSFSQAETNTIDVDSDYYYKVVFSLTETADNGVWGFTWGLALEDDISDGDEFYIKPGSNTTLEIKCSVASGDTVNCIAGFSVKKYYGV